MQVKFPHNKKQVVIDTELNSQSQSFTHTTAVLEFKAKINSSNKSAMLPQFHHKYTHVTNSTQTVL